MAKNKASTNGKGTKEEVEFVIMAMETYICDCCGIESKGRPANEWLETADLRLPAMIVGAGSLAVKASVTPDWNPSDGQVCYGCASSALVHLTQALQALGRSFGIVAPYDKNEDNS